MGNFRFFHAPDRRLVFDLNDFDETLPGPFEWDVKRLTPSIMVTARNNGFSRKQCRAISRAAARTYRETIAYLAGLDRLDLHYYRIEVDDLLAEISSKKARLHTRKLGEKATRKDSLRALNRLTDIVDGRRVIVPDPPLVQRIEAPVASEEFDSLTHMFEGYRSTLPLDRRHVLDYFSLVDIAHKVVGVGSVGTRCMIMLLESGGGAPLFLQCKEATASVFESHLNPSPFDNAGQRVVEGQQMIQGDKHNHDYYLRQLWDSKGVFDVENMRPTSLWRYAGFCGRAMARGHARSGDVQMIRGYLGKSKSFEHAITEFAEAYADRTDADLDRLRKAITDKQIKIVRDI